ncbi:hypothetical protein CRG98_000226 [Punica granatum]|uniref:Uncharacterized protein n=1 Tax=Punica granatum TaxID=22663 RepID=A0A2I0LFE6_PUNGR|nr:hypothetical protein CRG98_000226 [Punica granatum]
MCVDLQGPSSWTFPKQRLLAPTPIHASGVGRGSGQVSSIVGADRPAAHSSRRSLGGGHLMVMGLGGIHAARHLKPFGAISQKILIYSETLRSSIRNRGSNREMIDSERVKNITG